MDTRISHKFRQITFTQEAALKFHQIWPPTTRTVNEKHNRYTKQQTMCSSYVAPTDNVVAYILQLKNWNSVKYLIVSVHRAKRFAKLSRKTFSNNSVLTFDRFGVQRFLKYYGCDILFFSRLFNIYSTGRGSLRSGV